MKKLIAIAAIISITIISLSFIEDKPGYKNLKVLSKNTTHDQMDSIMKHFSKSLGVKCSHCHVRGADGKKMDFAKDTLQQKEIARSMMRMTAKLNKKYFGIHKNETLAVSCYSCHNGNKEPKQFPPADKDDE